MNIRNIDPLKLPSLLLKERSSLPNCSAVYFVTALNNVIYIGKAQNLAARWVNHHKWSKLAKMDCPVKIAWLECSDTNLLVDIEAALIEQFRPKLNISQRRSSNEELRAYVSLNINRTFRVVAALKDKNLSDTIAEAIEYWLNSPENQELIKKHNLDK